MFRQSTYHVADIRHSEVLDLQFDSSKLSALSYGRLFINSLQHFDKDFFECFEFVGVGLSVLLKLSFIYITETLDVNKIFRPNRQFEKRQTIVHNLVALYKWFLKQNLNYIKKQISSN